TGRQRRRQRRQVCRVDVRDRRRGRDQNRRLLGEGRRRVVARTTAIQVDNRHVVHRRHADADTVRDAAVGAVADNNVHRPRRRGRRVAGIVVLDAVQDRLVGRLRRRAGDRQHPGRRGVAHRQAARRRRRRRIERQRLHPVTVRTGGQRRRQRRQVGRVDVRDRRRGRDQNRRLLGEGRRRVVARTAAIQIGN